MKLTEDKLEEMSVRQLGHLIENAGDEIVRRENIDTSVKSLGDIAAETGTKIVALDSGRITY